MIDWWIDTITGERIQETKKTRYSARSSVSSIGWRFVHASCRSFYRSNRARDHDWAGYGQFYKNYSANADK